MPAPRYHYNDRPATAQAMREALAEAANLEREISLAMMDAEEMDKDIPDEEEEELMDTSEHLAEEKEEEKEEEKIYAEMLWSQLDSSGS